jgi:hypothetical protein
MMRWVALGLIIVLLVIGWVAYSNPTALPGGGSFPILSLVSAAMVLMLVAGFFFGVGRTRLQSKAAIAGILFWPIALIVIVLVYNWIG